MVVLLLAKILVNLPYHKKYYGTGDTLCQVLWESDIYNSRTTHDAVFVDWRNIHFFLVPF